MQFRPWRLITESEKVTADVCRAMRQGSSFRNFSPSVHASSMRSFRVSAEVPTLEQKFILNHTTEAEPYDTEFLMPIGKGLSAGSGAVLRIMLRRLSVPTLTKLEKYLVAN